MRTQTRYPIPLWHKNHRGGGHVNSTSSNQKVDSAATDSLPDQADSNTGSDASSEPKDVVDPLNPTDAGDTSNSTDPTDPADPSNPTDPIDPDNPENPDPETPDEPAEPVHTEEFVKIDDAWHWFNAEGVDAGAVAVKAGWFQHEGNWYWFKNANTLAEDEWLRTGGTWYYLGEKGRMLTGHREIEGKHYFLLSSGAMLDGPGWKKVGSTWYYPDASGALAAQKWRSIGGSWYWFDEAGRMKTGWLKLDNKWYYLKGSGAMATGWEKVGSTWYLLHSSGEMLTGWQKLGKTWYYLADSGAMAANTWVGNYYLGSDGAWIPNPTFVSSVLGVSRQQFVNHLNNNSGSYLGTAYKFDWPYPTSYTTGPWHSNGYHPYEGHPYNGVSGYGMNCAGFIARAWCDMGLENSGFMQSWKNSDSWMWVNAAALRSALLNNNVLHQTFNSKATMLASGVLEKGDIIIMDSDSGVDDHVGIFWGNNSSHDRFWHSLYYRGSRSGGENMISDIYGTMNSGVYYVFKF